MTAKANRTGRVVVGAAALGLLVTIFAGCSDSDGDELSAARSPLDSIVLPELSEVPGFDSSVPPVADVAPAAAPVEAVRRYLDAEVAGAGDQSYLALSAASRADAGLVDDWTEAAFGRPRIIDYELDALAAPPAGTSDVEVTGTVTLEPRLDEVHGYVPERATVEWEVVAEDGGWRVDLVETASSPILPDEQGAVTAAAMWAAARQQCRVDGEFEGSLLGSPSLADQLCGVAGELTAGQPAPLDDALASQVVAAFGPDAVTWARSVALSGPSELSVVTAPFGDHWVVVGVGA